MEEIMKAYGGYVLEAFVAICLVSMLLYGVVDDNGNRGVFKIIGANIQIENTDYAEYKDFQEGYLEESKKEPPKIIYTDICLRVGSVKLSDHIKASDFNGNAIPIKIESIKSTDEIELLDTYNPATAEIVFERPGIYTLIASAVDENNRTVRCTIRIPVNK